LAGRGARRREEEERGWRMAGRARCESRKQSRATRLQVGRVGEGADADGHRRGGLAHRRLLAAAAAAALLVVLIPQLALLRVAALALVVAVVAALALVVLAAALLALAAVVVRRALLPLAALVHALVVALVADGVALRACARVIGRGQGVRGKRGSAVQQRVGERASRMKPPPCERAPPPIGAAPRAAMARARLPAIGAPPARARAARSAAAAGGRKRRRRAARLGVRRQRRRHLGVVDQQRHEARLQRDAPVALAVVGRLEDLHLGGRHGGGRRRGGGGDPPGRLRRSGRSAVGRGAGGHRRTRRRELNAGAVDGAEQLGERGELSAECAVPSAACRRVWRADGGAAERQLGAWVIERP